MLCLLTNAEASVKSVNNGLKEVINFNLISFTLNHNNNHNSAVFNPRKILIL